MTGFGHDLEKIVNGAVNLKQVRKTNLHSGDVVLIYTRNSIYSVRVLENGMYRVSGGWFDRHGLSPVKTTITGCTWGGSIIKLDIIAACGLCLEFGNRVVTSPIRKVKIIHYGSQN